MCLVLLLLVLVLGGVDTDFGLCVGSHPYSLVQVVVSHQLFGGKIMRRRLVKLMVLCTLSLLLLEAISSVLCRL